MASGLTDAIRFVSDQPSDSPEDDRLSFGPYAKTLAQIILSDRTRTPLTIGIFGSWGSGKTTLMKLVERALRDPTSIGRSTDRPTPQIFTVWFNAWLYSKEDSLWRALVTQVLAKVRQIAGLARQTVEALDISERRLHQATTTRELGDLSIKASSLLRKLESSDSALYRFNLYRGLDLLDKVAAAASKTSEETLADLRDGVRQLEQERIQALDEFRDCFQDLMEDHILKRGYMVVFVDDLDRCLPDKAVEVLEAIKLFLDVPGCVFVLGIDQDVIERGIRLRYGELGSAPDLEAPQFQISREVLEKPENAQLFRTFLKEMDNGADVTIDGARYLEKIIQIPFYLPPISPTTISQYAASLSSGLSPTADYSRVFAMGLEPNPRQIKRAINVFTLLWKLSDNLEYRPGSITETRVAKLVVLQQRHGELYKLLRKDSRLLKQWELYFRLAFQPDKYQQWATHNQASQTSPAPAPQAVWPEELKGYDDLEALKTLLLLHDLPPDPNVPDTANFVTLRDDEIQELIFLTQTSETTQKPATKAPTQEAPSTQPPGDAAQQATGPTVTPMPMDATPPPTRTVSTEIASPVADLIRAQASPLPLHKLLRLSEQEAGFTTQSILTSVARLAETVGTGKEADLNFLLGPMTEIGQSLRGQIQSASPTPGRPTETSQELAESAQAAMTKLESIAQKIAQEPDAQEKTNLEQQRQEHTQRVQEAVQELQVRLLQGIVAGRVTESLALQMLYSGPSSLLMTRVPWELVCTAQPPELAWDNFWGGRHIIERPLAPGSTSTRLLSTATIGLEQVPRVRLVYHVDTGPRLADMLRSAENIRLLPPIDQLDRFREAIAGTSGADEEPADIYIIHGRGRKGVGTSLIEIGKGQTLGAQDLADWAAGHFPGTLENIAQTKASAARAEPPVSLSKLYKVLSDRFSDGELQSLAFDLEIDYESLPGEGKLSKARELVAYLERRGRVRDLIDYIARARPDISQDELGLAKPPPPQRPPTLFYLILDGNPHQDLDWAGWFPALEQLGAYAIIAPLIHTPGEWPLHLAQAFIKNYVSGATVGHSLLEARKELTNPLGLMYVHYGLPTAQLAIID